VKQVNFKKIRLQNFLSVGNKPIEIDFKRGLNIITGANLDKEDSRNGVGKSTIISSLSFVLFGNPLKELKKDQIVNYVNKKKCEVSVWFDIIENNIKHEYFLQRGIAPTMILLEKDGVDITESSIPKTTIKIEQLLSSSFEVFVNSVFMTIDNTIPFMAQTKVNKRKFIEGILRLGIFSEMLLLARQDFNDTKKELDIESTKYNEIEKSYKTYLEHQKNAEKIKLDRINILNQRSENNKKEIDELIPKLKEIEKTSIKENENNIKLLKKRETKCRADIRENIQNIATNTERIKNHKEQIEELLQIEKEDKCLLCLRPFETKGDYSPINKKIKSIEKKIITIEAKNIELQEGLNDLESVQDKCLKIIDKIQKQIQIINNNINQNENIKSRIEQLKKWNKQIVIDIKELNSEKDNFNDSITESENRLKALNEILINLQAKLAALDVIKFIVSEEGVKSYIVKKILKILNGKLNSYLKLMEANCTCLFNEYFEEIITNEIGQECSYHNFSSGERKRIDLAMLFTFMDIRRLQGDVFINISFYDEILDTSIDDKGINCFIDILQKRIEKYNECVYIISHKDTAVKKATGEVIYLEKKNGFTYKTEYQNLLKA
jgi:DNA repair exonuclease SbcCD ATPase subunit